MELWGYEWPQINGNLSCNPRAVMVHLVVAGWTTHFQRKKMKTCVKWEHFPKFLFLKPPQMWMQPVPSLKCFPHKRFSRKLGWFYQFQASKKLGALGPITSSKKIGNKLGCPRLWTLGIGRVVSTSLGVGIWIMSTYCAKMIEILSSPKHLSFSKGFGQYGPSVYWNE